MTNSRKIAQRMQAANNRMRHLYKYGQLSPLVLPRVMDMLMLAMKWVLLAEITGGRGEEDAAHIYWSLAEEVLESLEKILE